MGDGACGGVAIAVSVIVFLVSPVGGQFPEIENIGSTYGRESQAVAENRLEARRGDERGSI
jgi:hypothetical protein